MRFCFFGFFVWVSTKPVPSDTSTDTCLDSSGEEMQSPVRSGKPRGSTGISQVSQVGMHFTERGHFSFFMSGEWHLPQRRLWPISSSCGHFRFTISRLKSALVPGHEGSSSSRYHEVAKLRLGPSTTSAVVASSDRYDLINQNVFFFLSQTFGDSLFVAF